MTRSHVVLAVTLLGVAGLVLVAQATTGDGAAAVAVDGSTSSVPAPDRALDVVAATDPDCTISIRLEVGMTDPEVSCLEARLIDAGVLDGVVADDEFDAATEAAVEAFQDANALVVDGVVGPRTAIELGSWAGPDVLPPDPDTCPDDGRAAVVDRFNQRAWLCESGVVSDLMPITSAINQPDPGTYEVYAKDMNASSTLTGEYSTMTHFVAFTYGKYQGARIAFHSVPKYANGEYVQPLDSVGTQDLFGDSSGCIRVLPDDAELIWSWLDVGDTVRIVT